MGPLFLGGRECNPPIIVALRSWDRLWIELMAVLEPDLLFIKVEELRKYLLHYFE